MATAASEVGISTRRPRDWFGVAYAIVLAGLIAGWMLRDRELITPEYGAGYWLGIVGGSLMLLLLLYPMRKRMRWMRILGSTRSWFRLHMLFGLFGPLLVLYHCNFDLGSINSRVALFCMLLVASSGLVGKYLYARIHHGLYGRKASLLEFQKELATARQNKTGVAALMPELAQSLEDLSRDLLVDDYVDRSAVSTSLAWALNRPITRFRLKRAARKELRCAAAANSTIRENYSRLLQSALRHIDCQFAGMRRVARFSFYERMFSAWHILHLPLFFMMILSAIVHIVAVHMY